MQTLSRGLQLGLFVAGVALSGYWLSAIVRARAYQILADRQFSAASRLKASTSGANSAMTPTLDKTGEGSLIGKLQIPRLGLSVMIVQGVGKSELRVAVGHMPQTALPGHEGNTVLAAHRDTFFAPLRLIRENDTVIVTTADGRFDYRVASTEVVDPNAVQVLYPTKTETLTLITCYPFHFVGPAPRRFIVRAQSVGSIANRRSSRGERGNTQ